MRRDLVICVCLVVATLAVYGQVARHDFVNFDDDRYVYENPHVRYGLTWQGVAWAFTTTRESNWHPLTWLSHMLDCHLFGLNAGDHHLVNVLLHILNSVLLYLVLGRMTGAPWRSAMVAALFALHPLHVESVAWISERKDVLSTLFFLLTLWAYAHYAARPSLPRYGLVFGFLALGLMAKPMLVTVPFVLLLLDYWPLERVRPGEKAGAAGSRGTPRKKKGEQGSSALQLILEKVPFLVLAIASSVVTFAVQHHEGTMGLTYVIPFSSRIANALCTYITYIGKMLWPGSLAVFYPYRNFVPAAQWAGAALALTGMSAWVVWAGRRRRYLTVGWLWYLGTLVPVIGLVQVGAQSMADRYTYVPLIGLFMMAVWGAADLMGGWRGSRIRLPAFASVIIIGCMLVTYLQVGHWQNAVTLFEHALKVTQGNARAHNNLGDALITRGSRVEAIRHYEEALRINPYYATAHNSLGILLAGQGRTEEAIAHYREALRIDPEYAQVHSNLAIVLAQEGKQDEAVSHLDEALRINPELAQAHNNLGLLLSWQGKAGEAIAHYQAAIRLNPGDPAPYDNLAWVRATHPDPRFRNGAEAVELAKQACELSGHKDPNLLDTLAAAYAEAGRIGDAVTTAQEALLLARSAGATERVLELEKRLQAYRGGISYREAQ